MRTAVAALLALTPTALPAQEAPVAQTAPDHDHARAREHFTRAVAARGQSTRRITPAGPEQVDTLRHLAVDGLFPFTAELSPTRRLHGFAAADGRVVLAGDSPIPLLRACHLLDPARSLSATDIATRLAWLEQQGELVLGGPTGDEALTLLGRGAGAFTAPAIERTGGGALLTYAYQPRGQGRHVPPPKLVAVRIGPDYQPPEGPPP